VTEQHQEESGCAVDRVAIGPRRNLVADSLSAGFEIMLALTMIQRLVGFLRQLIICRYLDPEELGRWNLAYSMLMLAAPLLVLGIPGTYGRYTEHFRQKGQLHLFWRKTTLATLILVLIGTVLLLLTAEPVAWLLFRDTAQASTIYTVAFALVSVIGFNYTIEGLTSLRQVKAVSWLRFLCGMAFITFSVLLLLCSQKSAISIVVGYGAACLVASLIGGYVLLKTLRETGSDSSCAKTSSIWVKLLPFAGWLWLADLLANLFAAIDRYMIVHFADASARTAAAIVGQYHSSRLIPEQMVAMATLSAAILLPYLSNNWESGDRKVIHRRLNLCLKLYALAMTVMGVALMLMAPWLFGSVLGGKYAEGLVVTPWSIVACIWYGLYALVQTYLLCCERAGYSSIALAIGLVINVVLNLALLPILGLKGAVMATAISSGCALWLIGLFAKRFGMRWNHGIVVVMTLPICLVHSTTFALLTTMGVAVAAYFTPLIFDNEERAQLARQLHQIRHQVEPWLAPVWRTFGGHRPTAHKPT
jgi:PST family polysaccharide transporter